MLVIIFILISSLGLVSLVFISSFNSNLGIFLLSIFISSFFFYFFFWTRFSKHSTWKYFLF
jgi:hypothetical protein